MKVEDKARELISKMLQYQMIVSDEEYSLNNAKQCALICVDEIIELLNYYNEEMSSTQQYEYWQEVKQEINKQ